MSYPTLIRTMYLKGSYPRVWLGLEACFDEPELAACNFPRNWAVLAQQREQDIQHWLNDRP